MARFGGYGGVGLGSVWAESYPPPDASVGGWLCDRMDRKTAYVWFGIFQAAAAVAMALLPRNPAMFVLWSSVYAFITGFTYAAFSAFVLEAIGKGAAATKYSALASLSNVPIYYMTNLDGWAHDRWGSNGMLFVEAVLGVVGAVVFIALAKILLPQRTHSGADVRAAESEDGEVVITAMSSAGDDRRFGSHSAGCRRRNRLRGIKMRPERGHASDIGGHRRYGRFPPADFRIYLRRLVRHALAAQRALKR